jgi:hypothetical protein
MAGKLVYAVVTTAWLIGNISLATAQGVGERAVGSGVGGGTMDGGGGSTTNTGGIGSVGSVPTIGPIGAPSGAGAGTSLGFGTNQTPPTGAPSLNGTR